MRPTLRLRTAAVAVALALALLPARVLAHEGHEHAADDGGSGLGLTALLFGLGGALVVAGIVGDRADVDLPGQYVEGLVFGGAALVLVVAPLVWLL